MGLFDFWGSVSRQEYQKIQKELKEKQSELEKTNDALEKYNDRYQNAVFEQKVLKDKNEELFQKLMTEKEEHKKTKACVTLHTDYQKKIAAFERENEELIQKLTTEKEEHKKTKACVALYAHYKEKMATIERENKEQVRKLTTENEELIRKLTTEKEEHKKTKVRLDLHTDDLEAFLRSNVKHFPFLAGAIADYLTYDIEILAKRLDWGKSVERAKKVASIREIRAEAKRRIEESRVAVYQLEYLRTMFPAIDDILETDYNDLHISEVQITDYDPVRDYLSRDEWKEMSDQQKNQLALDRYIESRKKTKWQIGRDYELYVGYKCSLEGYLVDFFGSYKGMEDLGRDLIAKKGGRALIIQCKYWSQKKEIHEKHIAQLYGTAVCYSLETKIPMQHITPVLVTNISISETARRFAEYLSVEVVENFEAGEFPRIKCNIGRNEYGVPTKIYHLPMDQQYDAVKIDKKDEFFAFTVEEAEAKGFRRAFKWHSKA